MSAREQVITMLDDLTEEQLELLITFLNSMESKATKQKKSAASLYGIFHDVADPVLAASEGEAWTHAAVENEKHFLEEYNSENS